MSHKRRGIFIIHDLLKENEIEKKVRLQIAGRYMSHWGILHIDHQ